MSFYCAIIEIYIHTCRLCIEWVLDWVSTLLEAIVQDELFAHSVSSTNLLNICFIINVWRYNYIRLFPYKGIFYMLTFIVDKHYFICCYGGKI